MNDARATHAVPRIESLKVTNYRALRNLTLDDLTPMTVLLGPNGSGKSTVFDVFAFLSECFNEGLRRAWDKRGRFRELRSRGADGPITIELRYREASHSTPITYHLAIDEDAHGPFVAAEWLQWSRGGRGRPFRFLDFTMGQGNVVSGEKPEKSDTRVPAQLTTRDALAVSTLGQLASNPRVAALRQFITGWHLSYLSADNTRGIPEAGPRERLSQTGDNLPNVIQYLREQHPERLHQILQKLTERVPRLEQVTAEPTIDGRLVLMVKDAPFERPVMARYASDGTLKMLAYLTVLYDPDPPPMVGLEEPENQLHPRLLHGLAEECRNASARTQLMVTTHSPFFVNGVQPGELRVLYRDENGYTQARRAADMRIVNTLMANGASLGDVWMEGHFEVGDPLTNAGGPRPRRGR